MKQDFSQLILHLSLIEKVGPSQIQRLLGHINAYEPEQWYRFNQSDFKNIFGITEQSAQLIVLGLANRYYLDQELKYIEKNSINWITILDSDYPSLLKEIHLPPAIIYWKGSLPQGTNHIAVVGSRDANQYGYEAVKKITAPLVQQGWGIISGGARGIDAMAHQVTLDNNGFTVAVLGSGLLNLYPREHLKLFEKIVQKGGGLVSTFPLLMDAFPGNFPARNRIISGLSRGCLVVQASVKSGARITADFCLAQGKEVFAVPGPFDNYLSAGCHVLIGQGAKLTTSAHDILIEFGHEFKPIFKEEKPQILPLFDIPKGVASDPQEQAILKVCVAPSSMDELVEQTGIPLIELTHLLFNLQIKGKICQNMAGLWEQP
ncbi:MAG: DNA processing protein DprA [Candidatus Babeliales bacterium]